MCLDVSRQYKKPIQSERVAWKWMVRRKDCYMTGYTLSPLEFGKWNQCGPGGYNSYPDGFHVLQERSPRPVYISKEAKLVKVKVRGVHTSGKQDGYKCWVASEIWVPVPRKHKSTKRRA